MPIHHQTQPTGVSCVATCLAMLLDKPVAEVLEEFPRPMGSAMLYSALSYYGIKYDNSDRSGNLAPGHLYLAVVPSLNTMGMNHQILIDMWHEEVLDPCKGRENARHYILHGPAKKSDEFVLLTWTELIAILDAPALR